MKRESTTSGPQVRQSAELFSFAKEIPCAALVEQDGQIIAWNEAAVALHGRQETAAIAVARIFVGDFPDITNRPSGESIEFDCNLLQADGSLLPVRGALRAVATERGVMRLITVMAAAPPEAAIDPSVLPGELLAEAPEAIAITLGDRLLYVNREFTRLFGYTAAECIGANLDELISPEGVRGQAEELARIIAADGRASMETQRCHRDGDEIDVSLLVGPIRVRGDAFGLFYTFRDIRPQKRVEAKLQHQAMHDSLTGLANRALLTDRVQESLKRLRRDEARRFAVMFLDLDGFKQINDTLGHEAGDNVLRTVSRVLRDCLRPQDTLARFGGDEFAILLEDIPSAALAAIVAERLHRALQAAVMPDAARVSMSIGIAMVSSRGGIATRVLREADVAMYQAKSLGQGRSVVYERGMTMNRRARSADDQSAG